MRRMARNKTAFSDYIAGHKASGEQFWALLQTMGIPDGALLIPLDAEDREDRAYLSGTTACHVPGLTFRFQAVSITDAFSPLEIWRYRLDGPGAQFRKKQGMLRRIDAPYPVFTGLLETPLVDFSLALMRLPAPDMRRPWLLSVEAFGGEKDE